MYIPQVAINLKDKEFPQIRLGLQGPSGTGKTWSALSFPNVIVADLDGSLTAHAGKDLNVIPFYSADFMETYAGGKFKPKKEGQFHNRRNAFLHFMQQDALKLTSEQTLLVDSWSALQLAFDFQQELEPKFTQGGKEDDYHFWKEKINFSEQVISYFYSVKCHVVVTFHEDPVRDKVTGQLVDKIAPLMQGKFVAQLKRHFTDFFRTVVECKKNPTTGADIGEPLFQIQVRSDNKFDVKTRLDFGGCPIFVDVTDKSMFNEIFLKYKRKTKETI